LAIGLALAVANLTAIPLDGASVNPARSFGPAVLHGGTPLHHLWLFLVAPLLGGVLAALLAPMLSGAGHSAAGGATSTASKPGDAAVRA
jgi:aquaporin Z